jgi:hypothetical protein
MDDACSRSPRASTVNHCCLILAVIVAITFCGTPAARSASIASGPSEYFLAGFNHANDRGFFHSSIFLQLDQLCSPNCFHQLAIS